MLPPDKKRVIEPAKFAYSPLAKALEKKKRKQLKSNEKTNRCS